MSIENRESVGNFKTPEELAKALEEKSKNNLAERIRTLGIEAKNNSKSAREALKSGLSDAERTEITQTLPDKGLEVDLGVTSNKPEKKDPATEAGKAAIASAIGEDNAEKLEKGMSFFDKVSTGFDKIGDIFEQKGFIAGIGAIFIMLKGIFSGDFSALDGILNPENKPDINPPEITPSTVDKLKDTEYTAGLRALYMTVSKDTSIVEKSRDVLLTKHMRESSFLKLKTEYQNSSGIAKRLLGDETTYKDEQVMYGIKILIESEKTLNGLFSKEDKNWRDKPIESLLSLLHKKGLSTLASMKDKVDGLELSITSPIGNLTKIWQTLASSTDISTLDNLGGLSHRKELVSGIEPTVFSNMILSKAIIKSTDKSGHTIEGLNTNNHEKSTEFINNLFTFKDKIIGPIVGLFPKNKEDKAIEFFEKQGFTYKELIELYIITGGESDINNLNPIEKTLFYTKLWGVFSKNTTVQGAYNAEIISALEENSEKIKLPETAKEIMGLMLIGSMKIIFKALGKTMDMAWETYKSLDLKNQIAIAIAIVAALGIIIAGFLISPVIASTIAIATAVTSIGVTVFALIYNADKERFNKEGIKSPEEFYKSVKKDNNLLT